MTRSAVSSGTVSSGTKYLDRLPRDSIDCHKPAPTITCSCGLVHCFCDSWKTLLNASTPGSSLLPHATIASQTRKDIGCAQSYFNIQPLNSRSFLAAPLQSLTPASVPDRSAGGRDEHASLSPPTPHTVDQPCKLARPVGASWRLRCKGNTSTARMQNRGLACKIHDHMRRTTPLWHMPTPYQNTIGSRHPSIWAGPLELNLHSYVVGAR